jgi:hypothetical protein
LAEFFYTPKRFAVLLIENFEFIEAIRAGNYALFLSFAELAGVNKSCIVALAVLPLNFIN